MQIYLFCYQEIVGRIYSVIFVRFIVVVSFGSMEEVWVLKNVKN